MSDEMQAVESPEFDAGHGWRVVDSEGRVVTSGGVSIAQLDGRVAEQLGLAQPTEGERE